MSEISTYVSTGPGMPVKPGSPGRPQPGRRVAILARGRVSEEDRGCPSRGPVNMVHAELAAGGRACSRCTAPTPG